MIFDEEDVDKLELEEQFILRLPENEAARVRKMLKKKPKKIKKMLQIDLDVDSKEGELKIRKKVLYAKLVDLPTITESYKTTDKINLFKTSNVSQMLICSRQRDFLKTDNIDDSNQDDTKTFEYPHGITPPLKNVRKCRFRKTLKNSNDSIEAEDIEKEVLLLLKTDYDAISTRFEIFYESEPNNNCITEISEISLFGDALSDTEDTDESGASGLNDIMDFTT